MLERLNGFRGKLVFKRILRLTDEYKAKFRNAVAASAQPIPPVQLLIFDEARSPQIADPLHSQAGFIQAFMI